MCVCKVSFLSKMKKKQTAKLRNKNFVLAAACRTESKQIYKQNFFNKEEPEGKRVCDLSNKINNREELKFLRLQEWNHFHVGFDTREQSQEVPNFLEEFKAETVECTLYLHKLSYPPLSHFNLHHYQSLCVLPSKSQTGGSQAQLWAPWPVLSDPCYFINIYFFHLPVFIYVKN